MKSFKIILIILNFLLCLNSFHFVLFALVPFLKKKERTKKRENKKNKFLILIAARNEEKVLSNLIDSLYNQKYDKNLYRVCVIPNNSSDNTKKIALEKECLVIEPNIETKTKGEVLNYAFNYFKEDNSFDSYVIFDADNVVNKHFLLEINNKINEGYDLVQGFRDTKNLYENKISGSYAIFFYTQSLFVYETRSRLNESSTINGTGYAVTKKLIDDINYRAKTSTEDIELTCICHLKKEKIGYAANAIFYDEQVSDFKTSLIQRKRWIQGSMQVFKKYRKDLFNELGKKVTFEKLDMFQMLILPINQAIAFLILIISFIFLLPIKYVFIEIILFYVSEAIFSWFILKYYHKKTNKLISAILFFPIYHLSWIPIYWYSLINSHNKWDEIKHTSDVKIEEIIND